MHVSSSRSMLSNIIDRIRLPFRKDRELISSLKDIIGFYPHKMSYYKLALMHKSLGHRSTAEDLKEEGHFSKKFGKKGNKKGAVGRKMNNERLEFLGDAILDAVVGDIVYQHFPGKPEGFLTNTRSKLVQRETLGKLAQQIGLSRLILSSGRSATHNSYMDGNAFEALVGAIYLDYGYDACMKFWRDRILGKYLNIDKMAYKEMNFKSKLIEWAQKNRVQLDFRLLDQHKDESGSPVFKYVVALEGIDAESGTGFSKKESQQQASELTLKLLKKNKTFLDSVFAAKTERTKMDEDMIQVVPEVEAPQNLEDAFVQPSTPECPANPESPEVPENPVKSSALATDDDLNFDDIDVKPRELSREDIIAAAEAEAFGENK